MLKASGTACLTPECDQISREGTLCRKCRAYLENCRKERERFMLRETARRELILFSKQFKPAHYYLQRAT